MARERDMIMQANIDQRKDANKQNYNQYRSSYD